MGDTKPEKNLISNYIERSIQTKKEAQKTGVEIIAQIAKEVIEAYRRGYKVLWFGTSGNSPNVIEGIGEAKRRGAITITFTDASDGKLKGNGNVDYLLTVPSEDAPQIQESHIMIGYYLLFS